VFGVSLAVYFLGKVFVWRELMGFGTILVGLALNVHATQAVAAEKAAAEAKLAEKAVGSTVHPWGEGAGEDAPQLLEQGQR
jgi:hypothetical protein